MTSEIKVSLTEIDKLQGSLNNLVGKDKLTPSNVITVSTNLMQIVEKYPKQSGSHKKDLVIHALKLFVTQHLEGDEETALLSFIDMFLPSIIDMIVSIDKKEVAIKIKKGLKSCFSCC